MTRVSRSDTETKRRHAALIRRQADELADQQRAQRAALAAVILRPPAPDDAPGPSAA